MEGARGTLLQGPDHSLTDSVPIHGAWVGAWPSFQKGAWKRTLPARDGALVCTACQSLVGVTRKGARGDQGGGLPAPRPGTLGGCEERPRRAGPQRAGPRWAGGGLELFFTVARKTRVLYALRLEDPEPGAGRGSVCGSIVGPALQPRPSRDPRTSLGGHRLLPAGRWGLGLGLGPVSCRA